MPSRAVEEQASREWGPAACRRSSGTVSGTSEEFGGCGACYQCELASLGDCGPISQDCVSLLLDCVQNFKSAAAEEVEIDGEFVIHFSDQRQALMEPVAGAIDF